MLAIADTVPRTAFGAIRDSLFAGELIEVRHEEKAWDGASARLLRCFAVSLWSSDYLYATVAVGLTAPILLVCVLLSRTIAAILVVDRP